MPPTLSTCTQAHTHTHIHKLARFILFFCPCMFFWNLKAYSYSLKVFFQVVQRGVNRAGRERHSEAAFSRQLPQLHPPSSATQQSTSHCLHCPLLPAWAHKHLCPTNKQVQTSPNSACVHTWCVVCLIYVTFSACLQLKKRLQKLASFLRPYDVTYFSQAFLYILQMF